MAFRINQFRETELDHDLNFLKQSLFPCAVLVPKVEKRETLLNLLYVLPQNVVKVIPILETKGGLENALDIFSIEDKRIENLAFGHCDLNLDLSIFPFVHQYNPQYWLWIEQLNALGERFSKGILNSPYLALKNLDGFSQMLKNLVDYPSVVGQVSLSISQTQSIKDFNASGSDSGIEYYNLETKPMSVDWPLDFEIHRVQDRSFAYLQDGLVFSPQEFQASQLKTRGV